MGTHNVVEYEAQPDTLAVTRAVELLSESISTLKDVRFVVQNQAPSKERRAELRRQLSGVLADVEIVRLSIRE